MKWTRITIDTTVEATDMISYELNEAGFEGVEVEDHVPLTEEDRRTMYVDLLPDEIAPDDGTARVSCYVEIEDNEDIETIGLKAQEAKAKVESILEGIKPFFNIGAGTVTVSETEDKDWINNWKQFFKPFRLDDNIIIKPTWETVDDAGTDDIIVEIDPGTAFGTGSHETTRLCISGIKKYLKPGAKVLDLGCGSGILSIISMLLGAGKVCATDVDPNAVRAALENAQMNHIVPDKCRFAVGDVIIDEEFRDKCGRGAYDLVLANILADVIIPLSSVIADNMKPGGIFVSSGIINTKEDEVKEALIAAGFEIMETTYSGDWVAFTCRNNSSDDKNS